MLAPNAKLRALVVPAEPAEPAEDAGVSELAAAEPSCVHRKPARLSWARLLKRVLARTLRHRFSRSP